MGLTAAGFVANAGIQKKIHGSVVTLMISNEEMENITETMKSLVKSNYLRQETCEVNY